MNIVISEKIKKVEVDRPEVLARILTDVLNLESEHDRQKEHFWGIYLNARNGIKGIELITLGILNSSIVHPRETFCPALTGHATAIIVAHNHPSGTCDPSEDDIALTRRLQQAGDILGIELLDHLIITRTEFLFYSFARNGLLRRGGGNK